MPMSRLKLAAILGALVAFAPLSIDMYLPAFPAIGATFNVEHGPVQLTLASYLLGLSVGQLVYGPVSDILGRRRPLLFGIGLFSAGSLLCAFAPSIEALIGLRLLQALGGCAGMVVSRAIVRDLYSGAEAARFFSLLMLVLGLAPILGPLFGGFVLRVHGWDAIFWTVAIFGLACLVAVYKALPETLPRAARRTGGLSQAIGAYRTLLRDREFMRYALACGLGMAGMFAYISGSPFVFIELHGVAPEHFALLFGTNAAGFIAASQVNGRLVGRIDPARLVRVGFAVQVCACLVLLIVAATGSFGLIGLFVPLFIAISCLGFIAPNAFALAMQPHPEIAGAASALAGTIQFGCGALTGALVGAAPAGSAIPLAAGFSCASFLGAAVLFGLPRRRTDSA
jgi:MFS transporter, DHA1 family, multidrug resistance protein